VRLETLNDAERYLEGLINLERVRHFDYEKLGLARIRALLEAIGHPERGLPCVHIAGSKGKGSVALMTEALLVAAGRRVGTFTSPHLRSWVERFRIDAEPVAPGQLVSTLRTLVPAVERLRADAELRPSFFDVSTALALALFRELRVDAAVVEVGLGGRLDSTNVVEPRVSLLTAVQLEHTDKLGTTLEAIAGEKAGIARPGVPFLHGPLPADALAALFARAVAEDVPLEEVEAAEVRLIPAGTLLRVEPHARVRVQALGAHQATNAALAIRASESFLERRLRPAELTALERVRLPARIEPIGDTILDCAHTPDSARALRHTLATLWPERRWVLVVSISRDKDAAGILSELAPQAHACVLTHAEGVRSLAPESLVPLAWAAGIEQVEAVRDPHRALARARARRQPTDLLVVSGSLYLAGRLRPALVAAAEGAVG
jgi:dihydrofolate synthase/folylpolyglutamate synthase